MSEILTQTRIDKWLWAARFYKTRPLANKAVNGGKVHYNNQRVKPSQMVKIGDHLRISKDDYVFEIVIENLREKRGSAPIARTLYQETPQSIENRELKKTQLKLARDAVGHTHHKPTKKERGKIRQMRGKN